MEKVKYNFLEEALNLPKTQFQFKEMEGKLNIFDALRKKYLVLTQEEWVRQNLIHFLIEYKKYPKSLFVLERGLKYNRLLKRLDILIMNREGQPFFLIECKAPDVKLTQKTVEQVCIYNKSIGARYMGISNGKKHICMSMDKETGEYFQIPSFPDFVG